MKEMGVSTICIKDMAGVMGPQECYDLVKALKEKVGLPVVLHTHCTTGLAFITYLKGIEAGADVIDTASSAFFGRHVAACDGNACLRSERMGYDCVADADVMKKGKRLFQAHTQRLHSRRHSYAASYGHGHRRAQLQGAGGMLSNLFSQLKQQNALDRLNQVLEEIPRVREDLGYPPRWSRP